MIILKRDPSSFHDPAGYVFFQENRVFRYINQSIKDEFNTVDQSGCLQKFITEHKLVDYTILSDSQKNQLSPEAALILEHPKLPFISYAYEWSFNMLQSAALLHLELHLASLEQNITMIDSTSFNIQFLGNQPCFIDHLSFRPYIENDIWWGYQSFCQQFLNPLLLQAYCKVDFQPWLKGGFATIPLTDLYEILPWHKKFNWRVFFHLGLQTKLQHKSSKKQSPATKKIRLPKSALINLLKSMHTWVKSITPHYQHIYEWQDYENLHLYSELAISEKKAFVAEFCQATNPICLWDLGCNQGEFSKTALENTAKYVIGFDIDPATIDKALLFSKKYQLNFLPLVMNFANPSPALGWNNKERKSLSERNNADSLLALALIHHLRIQNNVPLSEIINYLFSIASTGVIEFVPKTDPKVQLMLKFRQDIFMDYDYNNFIKLIQEKAAIIKTTSLTNTERKLIWYKTYD